MHRLSLDFYTDPKELGTATPVREVPHWPSGLGVCLRSRRSQVWIPLAPGFFQGQVIPVTSKLALQWLPCQATGIIGSTLGLVSPSVSILWLGEVESWICNFCLSVATPEIVCADPFLRYTSMLLGCYSNKTKPWGGQVTHPSHWQTAQGWKAESKPSQLLHSNTPPPPPQATTHPDPCTLPTIYIISPPPHPPPPLPSSLSAALKSHNMFAFPTHYFL